MFCTNGLALNMTAWLSIWCLVWGGFYLLLGHGVNYVSSPLLTSSYFFLAASATVVLFKNLFVRYFRHAYWDSLFFLPGASLCLAFCTYSLLRQALPLPGYLASTQRDMFFLFVDPWYFIPKAFDILFQQVLLLSLTLLLAQKGFSLNRISLVCLSIFGTAHLFLFARNGAIFGGYFLLASIAAGWLFPRIMISRPSGVALTFSLHVLFYILTTLLFCAYPSVLL